MTPIHDRQIDHPMAWRGQDLRKEAIAFDLTAAHVAALGDVLRRVRREGLGLAEIGRDVCSHPALDADLARVLDALADGRGIAILRGFPVDRFDEDEIGTLYWAVGTHLGTGVSQSALGDRLGRVVDITPPGGRESARGYLSRRELLPHCDLTELVGLLCVRAAKSGGMSRYASGLAIHNAMLQERPDLLPVLYRGFPYARRGEQPADHAAITPYDVPVFCNVDGVVSVFITRFIIEGTMRDLGREYTPEEVEALNLFHDLSQRLIYEVQLEPGEASFVNNRTVLHARTEFVDWEDAAKKRLMLRLWLDSHRPRPAVHEMNVYENAGGRSGIDPVPGRGPAGTEHNVEELMRERIGA